MPTTTAPAPSAVATHIGEVHFFHSAASIKRRRQILVGPPR
ncbi:hypothetical protein [Gordonia sp. NPDC003585]